MLKVGINGLGRIGKAILRIYASDPKYREIIDICALYTRSGSAEDIAHLLKYDSVHGICPNVLGADNNRINFDFGSIAVGKTTEVFNGIDLLFECSGAYKDANLIRKEFKSLNIKNTIVSAPCAHADKNIVIGANEDQLSKDQEIISIGSCTTNCIAPIAKILDQYIGIEKGFLTTIHSYTNDQNILDKSHNDLQRARSGALSIIPTSTGAAKALGLVLPKLAGKIHGKAQRVPTPNVSFVDFSFLGKKSSTKEEINQVFKEHQSDILAFCEEKLVSIDFNGRSHSAIFDKNETFVIIDNFYRIGAWYDNEIGFSHRMLDTACLLAKQ